MKKNSRKKLFQALIAVAVLAVVALAVIQVLPSHGKKLILATTTSTYDSGLLDYILPDFEAKTGIDVQIISVGTGQALKTGENGDADVLLVHAPASEHKFIDDGFGINRECVMYNDFVILGPESDPAKVKGLNVVQALQNIYQSQSEFVSRGDDSGTNKKELDLWKAAGLSPNGSVDKWYLSIGQGMGDTLRVANERQAYTMSDRATYLSFKDQLSLKVLVEGDDILLNPYGVILVNPELHPNVAADSARQFEDWIMSEPTQALIGGYTRGGEQLFHPLRGDCRLG